MRWIGLGLLGCWAVGVLGCAGSKAGDTTRIVDYVTRGESQVTYTVVNNLPGMDGAVAIPTVPGKDVRFRSYYADGTPQWELDTQRSAVADTILAGAISADAAKYAADAATREWTAGLVDRALAMAQPFLQQAAANYEARSARAMQPDPGGGVRDQIEQLILLRLTEQLGGGAAGGNAGGG